MNNLEIWNKIVTMFSQHRYSEEFKLQELWMQICGQYLHYNSLDGEIDTKRSIRLGASDRVIPDIILKKDNKDYVIIELKKECYSTCKQYRNQLFSYLKQLKLSIGILITNKIEVFAYDYSKEDGEQKAIEIEFVTNNSLGEQFISLFEKQNLEVEKIKEFINSNHKIKDDFSQIVSITNEKLIKELLENYYHSQNYNENAIKRYIEQINIDIKQISNIKPTSPQRNTPIVYHNQIKKGEYNLQKNDAIKICTQKGIQLSNYITFANLSNINGKYPANINLNFLDHEWTILLNDDFRKKLNVLKIPANTFTKNDFYIRRDKNAIVLSLNENFEDYHPREGIYNKFYQYKIATIDY